MNKTTKRLRKIFSPANDETTFFCAGLGEMGWTTQAIARETGLSLCQVLYRLRIVGVKREGYRTGKSKLSKLVLRHFLGQAETFARDKANRA